MDHVENHPLTMNLRQKPRFLPLDPVDGYLPIIDHGLIGDGTTAGLVGRDGALVWLCLPRFDALPLFCRLLDARRGGAFTIAPEDVVASRQFYEPSTGVLVTEMRSPSGLVQLTDALLLRAGVDLSEGIAAGRHQLLRAVRVLQGRMRLRIEVAPRGGARAERRGEGWRLHCAAHPTLDLQLFSTRPLAGLSSLHDLTAGDHLTLILGWGPGSHRHLTSTPEDLLSTTCSTWRRWMRHICYAGPQDWLVRRSAITLKMLNYLASGAIVAAPTSSLPEVLGGSRNWDYRYGWIRDTAFAVYALRRIGLTREAWGFLEWALDAFDRTDRPRVLYTLDGNSPPPEYTDPTLEGYRRSAPVRWGNAAADQVQHDVYGEILDCAYQWAVRGGTIDPRLWARLRTLVEAARREWRQPDHGIWEVRTAGRRFTYSAALCQVALDRGARLAERYGDKADVPAWRTAATQMRQAILAEAWDAKSRTLTEHLGGGGVDASLLALPLRRLLRADDPRMVATTAAIVERLGAGQGLLFRYRPSESPDGLPGPEGAFLLCSFWLVDNLALQGRMDEAMALYDELCAYAGPLGLLPEQIDPQSGAFLGNYPQAFSHVGLISSGVTLARCLRQQDTYAPFHGRGEQKSALCGTRASSLT